MANLKAGKVDVTATITLELNESEMRALDALVGYGVDKFVEKFYEVLGKAYMEPHEAGLRSFMNGVNDEVRHVLHRLDVGRRAIDESAANRRVSP